MEETTDQLPPPDPTAPAAPPRTLRALWDRLRARPGEIRRAIAFRFACSAATVRAPAWWVRLCDRHAQRRARLAWWWEGYSFRVIRPRREAMARRWHVFKGWCRETRADWAIWWSLRTAPLRSWWSDRAAAAARRSDEMGERLADFRAARVTPAVRAIEERLPQGVDTRRVKEGLIVLRNEWEKALLAVGILAAASIIWWNWRLPPPPPPSAAELALVRGFTARAPKKFDFSKLVNLPKEPPPGKPGP